MNRTEQLINELFEQTENQQRCPYIKRDRDGRPYCGKDILEDLNITETRRMVCDIASLQLYCLAEPERHTICIYYKGEPLD